jgi:ATP-binding protein involved in chromosome partitioning
MLGAGRGPLAVGPGGVEPAEGAAGVRVISMDLLLESDDAPLRWREPDAGGFVWQSTLETGALRELLADVAWGALDVLVVDLPPGSDKLARLLALLPRIDTLVLVTTPSEAARFVVAKSARAAREAGVAEVGLVANMVSYRCPACGALEALYEADGARALAEATGLPVWAEVPFEPRLAAATDAGRPPVLDGAATPAVLALRGLAARIAAGLDAPPGGEGPARR